MTTLLITASYTQEQKKAFVEDPNRLLQREEHAHRFYGALGGKVLHASFMRASRWDFAVIVEFADEVSAHAAVTLGAASGAFGSGEVHVLATHKEMFEILTKARSAAAAFQAPSQV